MDDFRTRLERELVAVASRRGRLRFARSHLPRPETVARSGIVAALAAGVVAIAVSVNDAPRPIADDIRSANPPTTAKEGAGGVRADRQGTFKEQLALLAVLRKRTADDDDPQVARAASDLGAGSRRRYARLLEKAPSGYAFVLVPVERYSRATGKYEGPGAQPVLETRRNGLCLVRRGAQGGAGDCVSTAELRAGRLSGAIAGQVFGVVPDGVAAVRPAPGAATVAVRRNFYVYDARLGIPNRPPTWLNARGRTLRR